MRRSTRTVATVVAAGLLCGCAVNQPSASALPSTAPAASIITPASSPSEGTGQSPAQASSAAPGPTPTSISTPISPLPPGLGVPVTVPGVAELIVLAAEPWTDPTGATRTTVELWASGSKADAGRGTIALRDIAGAEHAPLATGRLPAYELGNGWLTFDQAAVDRTPVTLIWTVRGTSYEVPLTVAPETTPPIALRLAATTGLDGAVIDDALGLPDGYVAVGWVRGAPPAYDASPGIWTSTNGLAWQRRALPAGLGAVSSVARSAGGRLVAAGDVRGTASIGAIWTSADEGATWARVTGLPTDTASSGWWRGVRPFEAGLVVVGSAADAGQLTPHAAAMTSADGVRWTRSIGIESANCRSLDGAVSGGPGLIGWGSLTDCDTVTFGATAWWSASGTSWAKAPDAPDFVSSDAGGAATRSMAIVFGNAGGWTAIATWVNADGRPLVYASADAMTWAPQTVGASLRRFWPEVAAASGGDWLLGGFAVGDPDSGYAYQPQAWLGHGDTWVRVPVEVPQPPPSATVDYRLTAFADGPAGRIAIGSREDFGAQSPVTGRGEVWLIGAAP